MVLAERLMNMAKFDDTRHDLFPITRFYRSILHIYRHCVHLFEGESGKALTYRLLEVVLADRSNRGNYQIPEERRQQQRNNLEVHRVDVLDSRQDVATRDEGYQ